MIMNYLSAPQTAEKWGISTTRVTVLAKKGRIPGALQVGSRWLIPNNTDKPADGRTRSCKSNKTAEGGGIPEVPFFRYPSFEHKALSSFHPPLCDEEMKLKRALEEIYACRYEAAANALGNMVDTAKNRYHYLVALRIACTASIFLNDGDRFLNYYGRLKEELIREFPYKVEMCELIHELDASLGDSGYFSDEFGIQPGYPYHESYLPHLSALCTISAFFSAENNINSNALTALEITCAVFDKTDNYADIQSMHLYLGCIYILLGQKEKAVCHLKRAFDLAREYELYYAVVMLYYYMKKDFDSVLEEFPTEFTQKLEKLSEDFHHRYIRFMDAMSMNSIYRLIRNKELIYVLYAVQGLDNKKIAKLLNCSESSVKKKYSEILDMLKVESKKELVMQYRASVNRPDPYTATNSNRKADS